MALAVVFLGLLAMAAAAAGNFNKDFDITWGDGHAKILNSGQLLTLSMDKTSGQASDPRSSTCLARSTCS